MHFSAGCGRADATSAYTHFTPFIHFIAFSFPQLTGRPVDRYVGELVRNVWHLLYHFFNAFLVIIPHGKLGVRGESDRLQTEHKMYKNEHNRIQRREWNTPLLLFMKLKTIFPCQIHNKIDVWDSDVKRFGLCVNQRSSLLVSTRGNQLMNYNNMIIHVLCCERNAETHSTQHFTVWKNRNIRYGNTS